MDIDVRFKVSISPPLSGKIPDGSQFWQEFNASFENNELPSEGIAGRIYDGCAITTWHRNNWRTSANYLLGQHIGIDFDAGDNSSNLVALCADPFIKKYAAIVYTTPSHTPEAPRSRVVFLLDTPIHQAKNYTLAVSALLWLYGTADRKCKDPVRFFYGGKPGACQMEWEPNVLPLVVVKDMIEKYQSTGLRMKHTASTTPYQTKTPDEARIVESLKVIPAWGIEYDQWVAVLMAIHSALPNERGLSIAEQWAQGKDGEVRRKWQSFKTNGNSSGAVTIATVFGLAKEFGK